MRKFFLAAILLLVNAAASASADTKIELLNSASNDYLPAMIAVEKGFFAKRGLDVTMTVSPNPGSIAAAIASGATQIGTATAPQLALANESGLELVVIAGGSVQTKAHPTIAIVNRPAANLKDAADYKGKKVVTPGLNGVLHVMFKKWLLDRKVDPAAVTFIDSGFAQMGDMLKGGIADAALPVEPFLSRIVASGSGVRGAEYFTDVQDNTYVSLYLGLRTWADANRQAVHGFREALQEGIDFMGAHETEAKAIEAKYLKLPPQVAETLPLPIDRVDVPPERLQFWFDLCKQLGLVTTTLDARRDIVE